MKRIYSIILTLAFPLLMMAQGWSANYSGVMLQGFYWNSYSDTKWTNLETQADELSQYFNLVWIPQSANCGGTSMGYDDYYWFTDYNSSFGNESELRSLINTFKDKGIGTIADVVINHRKNVSTWVDFPAEIYKGVTYQLKSTDICADDDGGATKTWADANGYSLSSNNDTGEGWAGMRDLDHYSENVQTNVKAYLNMLLNDLEYTGFRYDMVKGYSGSFTGMYNNYANPTYSVGEYWDGSTNNVIAWLNATKVDNKIESAAFDFPFRYTVRDAINNSDWSKLGNTSVMSNASYRQYAVTFVENHDTEYRSSTDSQDPIKKDTLAANAFLIAMPGTPCVFLKHWKDCKKDIKAMINARKVAGITNTSTYNNFRSSTAYYANKVTGTNCDLLVAVGNVSNMSEPSTSTWTKVLSGYHYTYYLSNSAEVAWADFPSGNYDNPIDVKLTAVSGTSGAKLVYTIDGTIPVATSTSVASGTTINISNSCSLKVGLIVNGIIKNVISRDYTITNFEPYTATVYLKDPGWTSVYFYAWDASSVLSDSWPGKVITDTKTINGSKFYYRTFAVNTSDYTFNIIFDKGSNAGQTVDIGPISKDKYYEITSTTNKFTVKDITDDVTGIEEVTTGNDRKFNKVDVYSIDGRRLRSMPKGTAYSEALDGMSQGLYIINDKKVVK